MVSGQILQSTIEGIKDIAHMELCVMDTEGREIAATAQLFGEIAGVVAEFSASPADSQAVGQFQLFKVYDENQPEYVVAVYGATDNALLIGRMAAFQIDGLVNAFKERYDRDNFIKNLLLDNLLLVDIYGRAKKLHVPIMADRATIMIEANQDKDKNLLELMQGYVGTSGMDFVTAVDESNVVVVKTVTGGRDKELEKAAVGMMEYLKRSGAESVRVAYGTVVSEIKEVSRSYKEAKMALDVSRIFMAEKNVIAYNELGIGRLIYQLPLPLCKLFIRETFNGKNPEEFDDETLVTIEKFFENSLNISETSRQLFIHRNTLVYRLDKLMKMTGLDLRVFEDAITFRIALMVIKYMNYMEKFDYCSAGIKHLHINHRVADGRQKENG